MCSAEGVLWDQEVLGKCACQTFQIDELLQPRHPLLTALRFLSLLHHGRSLDARPILAMKECRKKGEADLETVYYPHMLKIFEVQAVYLPHYLRSLTARDLTLNAISLPISINCAAPLLPFREHCVDPGLLQLS